jgi:hypothetical protein
MIPRIFHFINISQNGIPNFGLMHYASIKSTIEVNHPDKIIYHCNVEPSGHYWDLIRSLVVVNYLEVPKEIFGNKIYHIAHAVDILRLQVLLQFGGVYMDLDTICVRPFNEYLFDCKCVLGLELNPRWVLGSHLKKIMKAALTLHLKEVSDKIFNYRQHKYMGFGNAIIMAEKDSVFLNKWLEKYSTFNSEHWNFHSIILPFRSIYKDYKSFLKILDYRAFYYPLYDERGLAKLFHEDKDYKFPEAIVHHLWANVSYNKYIKNMNPQKSEGLSYYEKLVRRYL